MVADLLSRPRAAGEPVEHAPPPARPRPPLLRVPGWPERLADLIANEQRAPFVWGCHDCATLAIDVVRMITGADLGIGLPAWPTRRDAMRALAAAGARSASEFFDIHLPTIEPASARRGDLVACGEPADPLCCPAVLAGASAHSRNEAGWVVLPRHLVTRAWQVGA